MWQQYLYVLLKFNYDGLRYNIDYIISETKLGQLSLYFACNALIIGNSIAIGFMSHFWNKNRKLKQHLSRIRNNQSFLIGTYYFWSFKITFFIVVINLFDNFDYGVAKAFFFVVPFIFVALFLESVKGLRRCWEGYTIKIMLIHSLILGCGIIALSSFNKSAYNKLNILNNEENPFVQIPMVNNENGDLLDYGYYSYRVRDKVKIIQGLDSLEYRYYREECSLEELMIEIGESGHHGKYRQTVSLYVPNDMPYFKLKEVEWTLAYHNLNRIYYKMLDIDYGREIGFRKNLHLTKEMFMDRPDKTPPPPNSFFDTYNDEKKTVVLMDQFLTDGKINKNKVENYFYATVNKNIVFQFQIGRTITLQDYIDFMNSYKTTVKQLRNEYELIHEEENSSAAYPKSYIEVY